MAQSVSKSRFCSRSTSPSDETRLSPAERVTAQIAALLERGVRPWVKPWKVEAPDVLALPLRACGQAYRGMNVIALWAASLERGFQARHWFTFKQALALDACVRKGELNPSFHKHRVKADFGFDAGNAHQKRECLVKACVLTAPAMCRRLCALLALIYGG